MKALLVTLLAALVLGLWLYMCWPFIMLTRAMSELPKETQKDILCRYLTGQLVSEEQ